MDLKFRHLQYFVVLAEELHFRRAADRLHISQPPLSQAIQQLEHQVGVSLLDRSSRQVALTAAGDLFLGEARAIIERANSSVMMAQRAGRGELGRLTFGFPPSVPFLEVFDVTLQEYRATYPDVMIQMEETVTRGAVQSLKSGNIDMAFLRTPLPELPDGVVSHHFYSDTLVVLVHEGHSLYERESLDINDLRGVPLVMLEPQQNTGLSLQLTALCEEAGFVATVAQYVTHTWTPLALVWAKIGISVVYSSLVERISLSRVRRIPLISSNSRNGISIALYEDGALTARHFCQLLLKNVSANPAVDRSL